MSIRSLHNAVSAHATLVETGRHSSLPRMVRRSCPYAVGGRVVHHELRFKKCGAILRIVQMILHRTPPHRRKEKVSPLLYLFDARLAKSAHASCLLAAHIGSRYIVPPMGLTDDISLVRGTGPVLSHGAGVWQVRCRPSAPRLGRPTLSSRSWYSVGRLVMRLHTAYGPCPGCPKA